MNLVKNSPWLIVILSTWHKTNANSLMNLRYPKIQINTTNYFPMNMKSHKKMRCCEWELLEILDKCVHCGSCLNGIGLHISLSLYNSYCRNLLWFFYYQVFCSLSGFIYRNSGDTIQQPCMVCEKMFNSSSHAVLLNCDYFSCHLWLWFCFHLPSKPDFLAFIWSKLLFLKCILLHFFFFLIWS